METRISENHLIKTEPNNYANSLTVLEETMYDFLQTHNLPTENILVNVSERNNVFKNVESALRQLDIEQRLNSTYISKFIAAVASGLFDAALNYLWDETVKQLRYRVSQYDIQYFYDNAVNSEEKRRKLSGIDDLSKIDDSELINGAKGIDLISDMGYRHLDHIKYMRNWASAAHPNQNEITGLQLISWLETCIKEVISLPISNTSVEIKRLLQNIKNNTISHHEAENIGVFFCDLTLERVNTLAAGFFGIYTRRDTNAQTRHNINLLLPKLWDRVDEETINQFGIKYGKYMANNDQEEARYAREFLQLVNAEQYLPEPIRISEIKTALDNLQTACRGVDNFYREPSFARQLERLVGTHGDIPRQLDSIYVSTIVEAFLTNGHGICWDAQPIYISLMKQFSTRQVITATLLFRKDVISSKLQFDLCERKFKDLLQILKPMVTAPAVHEFIEKIESFKGALYKLKDDSTIKRNVDTLLILIKD